MRCAAAWLAFAACSAAAFHTGIPAWETSLAALAVGFLAGDVLLPKS